MADSIQRAIWSSGIWFATAYGLGMVAGANLSLSDTLVDAGIMGTATFGSDLLHNASGMVPTLASSAVVSGALYAGAQKAYRNDSNYVVNAVAGAANDVLVDWVGNKVYASQGETAPEESEGVVLSMTQQ